MEVAATNDGWSTLEKLILVQAVNRHGENWVTISRVLRTHPAVALRATHDDKFFSQKSCALQWSKLQEVLEGSRRNKRTTETAGAEIPAPIKLSQLLYAQRMEELKASIAKDEEEYKALKHQIQAVLSGALDHRLAEIIASAQPPAPAPPAAAPSEAAGTAEPTPAAAEAPAAVKQEPAAGDAAVATEPAAAAAAAPPAAPAPDAGAAAAAPMEDVQPTAAPEVPTAAPAPAAEPTAAEPAPPAAEAHKPEAAAEPAAGLQSADAALVAAAVARVVAEEDRQKKEREEAERRQQDALRKQEEAQRKQEEAQRRQELAEQKRREQERAAAEKREREEAERRRQEELRAAKEAAAAAASAAAAAASSSSERDEDAGGSAPTEAPTPVGRKRTLSSTSDTATPAVGSPHGTPTSLAGGLLTEEQAKAYKNWKKTAMFVLGEILRHPMANPFSKPVPASEPDYHDAIKRPLDLGTIKARLAAGAITSTAELHHQLMIVFANACMYNNEDHEMFMQAEELWQASEVLLENLRSADLAAASHEAASSRADSGTEAASATAPRRTGRKGGDAKVTPPSTPAASTPGASAARGGGGGGGASAAGTKRQRHA